MDNTEINLTISGIKGYKRIVNASTGECGDHWRYPATGGESYYVGPDYINDPALNRGLEIELLDGAWEPGKANGEYSYFYSSHKDVRLIADKDFGKATALAYMEMMK